MATYALHKVFFFLKHARGISCHLNSSLINHDRSQFRIALKCSQINSERNFSDVVDSDEMAKKKKKVPYIPRVTLLSENNEISVVTLEEARKIAKRQNLKLIKVPESVQGSERETYKLMNMREYVNADETIDKARGSTNEQTTKALKTITLSSKITEHDLDTKIKSIQKILGKKHSVRIVISVISKDDATKVAAHIIKECKDVATLVTNRENVHNVKVVLRPIVVESKDENPLNES